VEADYLSWQPQAIPATQPARQTCHHHGCAAVETTATPSPKPQQVKKIGKKKMVQT